jgi:hypothetical protein
MKSQNNLGAVGANYILDGIKYLSKYHLVSFSLNLR